MPCKLETGNNFEEVLSQDETDVNFIQHTFTKTFTDSNNDKHPDSIKFGVFYRIKDAVLTSGFELETQADIRIKEIKMYSEMMNEEKDGMTGYCAGDGLTKSWNSNPLTEICLLDLQEWQQPHLQTGVDLIALKIGA